MKAWLCALILLTGTVAQAESLVAARNLRPQTVLLPEDVAFVDGPVAGALSDPAFAVGLETRVAIYAGRPIRAEDLGPPAIVDRNQIVVLTYQSGALRIHAEGRAMDRAGLGETIRVMNTSSKTTVSGQLQADGSVLVTSY